MLVYDGTRTCADWTMTLKSIGQVDMIFVSGCGKK